MNPCWLKKACAWIRAAALLAPLVLPLHALALSNPADMLPDAAQEARAGQADPAT